jgi:hypothetical protein
METIFHSMKYPITNFKLSQKESDAIANNLNASKCIVNVLQKDPTAQMTATAVIALIQNQKNIDTKEKKPSKFNLKKIHIVLMIKSKINR